MDRDEMRSTKQLDFANPAQVYKRYVPVHKNTSTLQMGSDNVREFSTTTRASQAADISNVKVSDIRATIDKGKGARATLQLSMDKQTYFSSTSHTLHSAGVKEARALASEGPSFATSKPRDFNIVTGTGQAHANAFDSFTPSTQKGRKSLNHMRAKGDLNC
mmetsp:Transcript_17795/g.44136  ORF Transcript_17795/g.44136 Transcript_17795/m.44136 type:complete len:161 (+) Transcript_17795:303-785(+)|eukprot:CAMPEP_0113889850 /NCGR_PEP_ID=MMETSP0780_2-20120614/13770_1 /TAXON_ID=652834 /ORGANISM="Palpitomonas bilix" /LENGTH=160 /DNA_ID=CAMNT_0000879083 /DNA_START=300 /DNA_END=782 /DNA_ORIENTATION=+ /assembly_acc=CAM_ASM_000599